MSILRLTLNDFSQSSILFLREGNCLLHNLFINKSHSLLRTESVTHLKENTFSVTYATNRMNVYDETSIKYARKIV